MRIAAVKNTNGRVCLYRAVFLLVSVLFFVAFCSPCAFADETVADDNQVNTGQLPDSSFIYDTGIYELTSSNTYYENQTVRITGEVVGDRIHNENDQNTCWITVSALSTETAGSVQVLVTNEQADQIDTYGKYRVTGSIVSVTGSYHQVCDQHDGLSDIHAESLSVSETGKTYGDDTGFTAFVPGLLLILAGGALLFFYLRERERLR